MSESTSRRSTVLERYDGGVESMSRWHGLLLEQAERFSQEMWALEVLATMADPSRERTHARKRMAYLRRELALVCEELGEVPACAAGWVT